MFGLKKNKRQRKKVGFAETKQIPHRKHPAFYKKKNNNDIDYLTFTHSKKVEIGSVEIDTIPMNSNINPKERGSKKSYAYPKVYQGKRDALHEDINDFSFTKEDRILADQLFDSLPKEKVSYTSNSKKKKK